MLGLSCWLLAALRLCGCGPWAVMCEGAVNLSLRECALRAKGSIRRGRAFALILSLRPQSIQLLMGLTASLISHMYFLDCECTHSPYNLFTGAGCAPADVRPKVVQYTLLADTSSQSLWYYPYNFGRSIVDVQCHIVTLPHCTSTTPLSVVGDIISGKSHFGSSSEVAR